MTVKPRLNHWFLMDKRERERGGEGMDRVLTILEIICTHCFLRSKTSSAKIMSTLRGTLSSSCEETVRGEGRGVERRGGE